ncbi:MAG TPA: ComF family protein [Longimicrobiales bacterium]
MRRIVEGLLDLVYAPTCLGCDGPISPGDAVRLVCRRCRSRLRPVPSPICERCGAPLLRTGRAPGPRCGECREWPAELRSARSAVVLAPPGDRLVHQLKYRGWHALARPLAERMAALPLPRDVAREASVVVPVPTTAARLRERGYNQAERLAREYARLTGRRMVEALERASAATTQTVLQPAARKANVAGAFRPAGRAAAAIAGAHCLLVDDVLTTGATATECSRTLVAAGARCVSIVTFARALDARRLIAT